MADPVCDEGWAHDIILRDGSCVIPVLGTKVMAVVILLLLLISIYILYKTAYPQQGLAG
jgi:hypothetical protein